MAKYITPVISVFSSDEVDSIITYHTCPSWAPSYSCQHGDAYSCTDGSTYVASCSSDASDCAGGNVYDNSLCPGTSEDECGSSGSTFICRRSSVG